MKMKIINVDEEVGGSVAKANENHRDVVNDVINEANTEDNVTEEDENDLSEEEPEAPLKYATPSYFFKLIFVFALIGPLSRESADFTKIASPISSVPSLNKNIVKTEMTLDALKEAARNAIVVIKSDTDGLPIEKRQKFGKIALEKNSLLKESSLLNQKLQTESLKRIQESVTAEAGIRRAVMLKKNIDEDLIFQRYRVSFFWNLWCFFLQNTADTGKLYPRYKKRPKYLSKTRTRNFQQLLVFLKILFRLW